MNPHRRVITLFLISLVLLGCKASASESDPQILGNESAPLVVEVFSDPQCPACADISPQVKLVVEQHPQLAYLKYYHYPLAQHELGFLTALATECAAEQDQFWSYLDLVFENQANLTEDYLYKIGNSLELNQKAFDDCLDSRRYKEKIMLHMEEAVTRGISSTPSIFVDGVLVPWEGASEFEAMLKRLVPSE